MEIDKLKKTKSFGPDNNYPCVLNEAKDILSEPQAYIVRKSLCTKKYHISKRKLMLYKLYLRRGTNLMSNYCPILLFESIIANNIRYHLDKYNLIYGFQHCFERQIMSH